MAIIKCKMCGGDMELSADKTFGTCEYCGSTMTLPKVDDDQRATAFNRGNHFRRIGEFDKALAVYERIVQEDDTDAEAHWCCALCRFGIEYVEDPATYEWIPTCHRASFDSFLEDVDYLAALEHSDGVTRRQYQKDAAKIAEVQKGILATSQNEEPFDVFICYKESDENGQRTKDSLLAQDIYYQLTDAGYRVFFSRITLEDKVGTQYEPYIFAALNSARIMVAVGTRAECFNAVWVKNEWSRFLALMKKDRTRLLLPCYRDMDPYDLPEQLSVLQSYDMGKIGFIQDLIRGMKKVLDGDKKPTVKETVVVQQSGGGSKTAALVERGYMALEDGDWAKADGFFEEALNNDARNAKAYLGKALAEEQCRTLSELVRKRLSDAQVDELTTAELPEDAEHVSGSIRENAIEEYADAKQLRNLYDLDRTYQITLPGRKKTVEAERTFWTNHKLLSRAEQFAEGEVAKQLKVEKAELFRILADWVKQGEAADEAAAKEAQRRYAANLAAADEKASEIRALGERLRELDYQNWAETAQKGKDPTELSKIAKALSKLNGYKDSTELAELCYQRAEKIAAEAAAEAKRQRILKEKESKAKAEKKKKIGIITGVAAAAVVAVVIVVTRVIIPGNHYKAAEHLLSGGDQVAAAMRFGAAGNYLDAGQRSAELWEHIAVRETVSAGGDHTMALKPDGTIVAPKYFLSDKYDGTEWGNIVAVSAGRSHTVGLKSFGTVVTTGSNTDGQRNVSDWRNIVAVSAGNYHTVGLKSDGTVVAVGRNTDGQRNVGRWRDIVAVSAGIDHTVGLKSDGTVVAVGNNNIGQCDVSSWTDIVAVSAGFCYTVGLKSDGTVVAVGSNRYGECNVSGWADIVAVSAGDDHTVGLKSDGTVVAVGRNYFGQRNVSDWTGIVAVSAGAEHTVGLKSDGTVVATGNNVDGQCNVSDWTGIKLPTMSETQQASIEGAEQTREGQRAAEYAAAEAFLADGDPVHAAITFGKLGDYQNARQRSAELWATIAVRDSVSAGCLHTVGLKSDGTVVTVGDKHVDSDWTDIVAVSAGSGLTVGLKSDGTVVAVGNLGSNVGDWTDIVAVSSKEWQTVGLKSDGTVVANGNNSSGQCNVSGWTDIVSVSAGSGHNVGLKSDGTVVAVGNNYGGQCNVSKWADIVAISAGSGHTVGLKADGTVVTTDFEHDTRSWTDIVAVSAGEWSTVGLKSDGTVVAVGNNNYGQCDVSGWTDIVAVSAGEWSTVGLKSDGTVVAVGNNDYGQCDIRGWTDIKLPNA